MKVSRVMLSIMSVFIFCSLAWAQDNRESAMDKGMDMNNPSMGAEMTMNKAPMHNAMHNGMMPRGQGAGMGMRMMNKSIVATSDGGIVVLMGNKLLKYDKNLELKKEVEIKCGKDMKMQCPAMMKDKKQCPFRGQKMQDKNMKESMAK